METYQQLSSSKACLNILFYGVGSFKTEPLPIPLDPPIPYEQVLIQCAENLSQNLGKYFPRESEKVIGPLLLPLFGLYAKEHTLQQWVADFHVFNSSHAGQEFYFRIKVQLPSTDKFAEKIPQGIFADYLFWQCADDFLSGRVWQMYGEKNKINDVDSVNFNVVPIFVASAQYHLKEMVKCDPSKLLHTPFKDITELNHILQKVKFWNMLRLFPQKMTPELKREYNLKMDPFLRCIAYRYLHKYIRQFHGMNKEVNLRSMRLMFVDSFFKEYVLTYGMEVFEAEKLEKPGVRPVPVPLIIRPFQDGCTPGLYFNKKLVARFQDILRVDLRESESDQPGEMCNVFLDLRNQPTQGLQLASQELAQSFVSVLDIYYRLKVDYHCGLLNTHQMGPSLQVLAKLRSYGPMHEEKARQHLRSRKKEDQQCADVRQYLIYQDCELFGLLHILATEVGSNSFTSYVIRFTAVRTDSGSGFSFSFSVHTSSDTSDVLFETKDPRKLMVYLNNTLINGQRIVPKEDELCGAMQFLEEEREYHYYTQILEDNGSGRRKTRTDTDSPVVYTADQVQVTNAELITYGTFSEVYRFTQVEQERTAILKRVIDQNADVLEAHRKGAERLMRLRKGCRFFIRVYGLVMTSPLSIIMESMQEGKGSLHQRIIDKKAPPFTWLQISCVLKQLAQCLDYLATNGLIYGSFRCSKILILSENSYEDQRLTIRLGDPSVSIYLDKLPVTDSRNVERLAWVAPERFQALAQHSVASEVYALGTTLWEMIALGKHPNTCLLRGTSFFAENRRLPTDFHGTEEPPEDTGNGMSRAREWVDSTDFQQASDVEEYVTGAQYSGDSAPERAPTATETEGARDQQDTPAQNVPLQKLKVAVHNLIQDCWHKDPDQRPSTTDIQRRAAAVSRRVVDAAQADVSWQQSIIVEQALQIGHVIDVNQAHRLKQHLQAQMRVEAQETKDRQTIEKLEMAVCTSIGSIIMADRLDFTGSKELGKGHYGTVKTAKLSPETETRQAEESCEKELVAVKRINNKEIKFDDLALFLKEALCICRLEHRNVVKLKGIVLRGRVDPYQLVLEYADKGSMEKYVLDNSTLLGTSGFKMKLKELSVHVAKGMEYVHQQNRIHGDLAARNVLLFSCNKSGHWPFTAKLCDFGLSHQLGDKGYYDLRKTLIKNFDMPAYLLPPEILRGWDHQEVKFIFQTDVWSYGLFLWEIFSNKKPDNILGKDPKKILTKYQQHFRLPKPEHCSPKIYDIMKMCWAEVPEQRPLFNRLRDMIDDLTERDMNE